MRAMCSAVLTFEAILMLLSILVLNGFSSLSPAAAGTLGVGLALACLVTAGLLGRSWGYELGHALQVVLVGVGFLAPSILFVMVMFAALWIAAYVIGLKIGR